MNRPATGSKDVTENITEVNNRQNLLKRARAKYFAIVFILRMVDLDSPLRKSYWNSYHCCNNVGLKESGETTSLYCDARWCLVCNRIRSAKMINAYLPVLEKWEDKCFVTLTIPNVTENKLRSAIDNMQAEFGKIKQVFYRQNKRKQRDDKLVGLRKLECTYNISREDYHPHYHAIIQGEQNANDLLAEWLRRFPDARDVAQDVRKADDASVRELFKYFTKLIAKAAGGQSLILPEQLDVMFRVLRGKRTFQNFGFTKPKETEEVSEEALEMAEQIEREAIVEVYQWKQELHDWIGKHTGEKLTGYAPSLTWRKFVESMEVKHDE
jgi:hypothetical protein